jgi:O-antigen ligase
MKLFLSHSYYYAVLLLFATLPFSATINAIPLVLLLLTAILLLATNKQIKLPGRSPGMILFLVYFFILLLSALYSNDQSKGFDFLIRNSAFLILPVAFLNANSIDGYKVNNIYKVFVVVVFVAIVICFVTSLVSNYHYTKEHNLPWYHLHPWAFSYHYLSRGLDMHSGYLSLMVSTAFFIILYDLFNYHPIDLRIKKKMKVFLLIILMIFLILLSGKNIIITTIGVFLLSAFFYFKRTNSVPYFFLLTALVMTLLITLVLINPVLKIRVLNAISLNEDVALFSGNFSLRFDQWGVLLDHVFLSNPIFGIGIGDVETITLKTYEEFGPALALENKFNAHNMYLQTAMATGIIGLVVLVAQVYFFFRNCIKAKLRTALSFIIIFSLYGITESALNRQKGIVLYTCFLFIYTIQTNYRIENSDNRDKGNPK